jgi:glycosyltransferase involved in cell wall biosynthesis
MVIAAYFNSLLFKSYMTKLIYLPVERYKNRWTEYVSGSFGMFADGVGSDGCVELCTVAPDNNVREITMGSVLDVTGRAKFAFWQIEKLLDMIQKGQITSESVIYIEDFWHPGFEMLPYACHIAGIRPRVYAFCHAQTADPNDFTYPMRSWMRPMERGWANWLTGIFVAADELREMLAENCIAPVEKVHTVGTVMRRKVLVDLGWLKYVGDSRQKTVVFASRPDPEKNPEFFLEVASTLRKSGIMFKYLSGKKLPNFIIDQCKEAGVQVREDISKREYFEELSRASLAFNCALQDFIGYCQLDALAAGCPVLCPNYLTFPTLLKYDETYLYTPGSTTDACKHVQDIVTDTVNTPAGGVAVPDVYTRFGSRYEHSVSRMLDVMFREGK